VLVVSIDGLRRDYLDDHDHALPTLRRLEAEGVVARSLRSVWPTVTYPAHTTLVTGVVPAKHGIVNNVVFDPFEKNEGGWYWYASDIRVPTIWDAAARAGIDVVNVAWPVTVGANIRTNVPQIWRAHTDEDDKLLAALTSPDALRDLGNAVPADHRSDAERAYAAAALIASKRPRLALVYLTDLDTAQHAAGPRSPKAWSTLEATDRLLADVLGAAQAASSRLAVVLVSDHGFSAVDRDVRPNVALHDAGMLSVGIPRDESRRDASNVLAYEAIAWKAGGSAAIMGNGGRRSEALKARVLAVFRRLATDPESGIGRVLDGEEVERQGGFPGALCVLEAASGATFSERTDPPMVVPSRYRGAHGYDPTKPEMAASLVLWGDGVRRGATLGDVPMIDVAPTIAALLGVPLPTADGHALSAALSDAPTVR
jgi:predicted AlkP superfamily pyrophosphatase or phosphodiesterase